MGKGQNSSTTLSEGSIMVQFIFIQFSMFFKSIKKKKKTSEELGPSRINWSTYLEIIWKAS
jgi:hypothetical protein